MSCKIEEDLAGLTDDERKEFNEQLEELTKQIDNYLKQKSYFEQKEKEDQSLSDKSR